MRKLLRRLNYWVRRRELEADLAAEIEAHRAMRQEDLQRAGVAPAAAVAGSRRVLGNIALAREDARQVWLAPWIEGLWQDVGYAGRTMRRSPAFAASMILVMALGIGAATCVFTLVDALALRELPVREPDRLVSFSQPPFDYSIFGEVSRRRAEFLSDVSAWNVERLNVDWGAEVERADVLLASGNFHEMLGVLSAAGRLLTHTDDRRGGGPDGLVAVLSYQAWQRRFGGKAAAIGQTLRVDRRTYTIAGVTPPGFFGASPGVAPDLTIPLTTLQDTAALRSTGSTTVHLLGRLRDGMTLAAADAALQSIWPGVLETVTGHDGPADLRAHLLARRTSLESARAGYSQVRNQFARPLAVLFALVALLLAVATASATNLVLARAAARRREFAVRLAIGAGEGRVVRQVLTETAVWTVAGAGAGLLLAWWGAGVLVSTMSTAHRTVAIDTTPNLRVLGFATALSFLAAAAAAAAPAVRAARSSTHRALREFGGGEGGTLTRHTFVNWLVTAQVALTVLLLFGAALFGRSLQRILSVDTGFDRHAVLVVSTETDSARDGEAVAAFYRQLRERLRAMPGVESASLSRYPPISEEDGAWTRTIGIDGPATARDPSRQVYFNAVTTGYFRTLGMRMIRGRDFTDADKPGAGGVVIVSEALAGRFFAGENPLGRRISIGRDPSRQHLEIVGVVNDANYQRLQEPRRSVAYLPCAPGSLFLRDRDLVAEVRTAADRTQLADRIRREIRVLDAHVPVRIQTLDDRIRDSLVNERVLAGLGTAVGVTALVLACAGLYGLMAFAVARRTNEMGLRLALGAGRGGLLWMVLRQSMVLTSIGVLVGAAASLALGRVAGNLLYEVTGADVTALAASVGLMLAGALIAAAIPSLRAARVDPMAALRSS
jgi:predicted permease